MVIYILEYTRDFSYQTKPKEVLQWLHCSYDFSFTQGVFPEVTSLMKKFPSIWWIISVSEIHSPSKYRGQNDPKQNVPEQNDP